MVADIVQGPLLMLSDPVRGVPLQLLDLNQVLNISTEIAAGFLDVAKCNILPTLTGQVIATCVLWL